jgi:hypothetical protein
MSDELKECPWCGVIPQIQSRTDYPAYTENSVFVAFIKCENPACLIRPGTACYGEWGMEKFGQLTNDEATDQVTYAWNRRAGERG